MLQLPEGTSQWFSICSYKIYSAADLELYNLPAEEESEVRQRITLHSPGHHLAQSSRPLLLLIPAGGVWLSGPDNICHYDGSQSLHDGLTVLYLI